MHDALLERYAARRFGDLSAVPYASPREAAEALFADVDQSELARQATVELCQAGAPARAAKRISAVFRDEGCGIEPDNVARTIFALGSAHKSNARWQQGAFGIGGAIAFRNADAVVLVSRCAPELSPREDRILVAVALWVHSDKGKGLHYLVTSDWREGENIHAEPWSAPASSYPDFAPGTHLALVSYGTEHIHTITAHADSPKSFERIVDTHLFRPVAPTRVTNHLIRDDHPRVHRGLGRRFDENPRTDRREDEGMLPYRVGGKTYQLPIRFYYFESEPGSTKGQKANFIAAGHTLVFTSNGQVHHHWGASEFRDATGLMRLGEHVLVVVETDPLPIKLRTDFFTADRSGVRASAEALRLEQDVAAFLRDWDELKQINGELIEQSLRGEDGRETINLSRQISRAYALKMRGFGMSSNGAGTGGSRGGNGTRKKIELYPDPTMLEGPEHVLAQQGKTKSLRFLVNATSSFFDSGRGEFSIACSHPDIGTDEISIGSLRDGRVRVMVAVPEDAKLGEFDLIAGIYDWERAAGGLGTALEWQTRLQVVDEIHPPEPSPNGKRSKTGTEGPQVALFWRNGDEIGVTPASPGKVEPVPASILAKIPEYAELATMGDKPILTIYLNNDYAPFKRYLSARQRDLTSSKVSHAKNRYAVDVGVAMLVLENDRQRRLTRGDTLDEALLEVARDAAAQGALSILPYFDEITKQAGIET
ncbi:MAG TPA: hypothetical protein VFL58_03020 [Gaiellaceae bacterium]|nr:hypothetical protein [Gaiellaceae bacterium]